MRHSLLLLALIWASFLVIFPFAAAGDTSVLHIGSHLIQLALLGAASVVAWRSRSASTARTQRIVVGILAVTVPVAFVCILAELAVAVVRLGQDGWVNRDTADVWEEGPHYVITSVTIPAMMLSMAAVVVLVILVAVQRRRAHTPVA